MTVFDFGITNNIDRRLTLDVDVLLDDSRQVRIEPLGVSWSVNDLEAYQRNLAISFIRTDILLSGSKEKVPERVSVPEPRSALTWEQCNALRQPLRKRQVSIIVEKILWRYGENSTVNLMSPKVTQLYFSDGGWGKYFNLLTEKVFISKIQRIMEDKGEITMPSYFPGGVSAGTI